MDDTNCDNCKFFGNDGWCELLFLQPTDKHLPCVDYESRDNGIEKD